MLHGIANRIVTVVAGGMLCLTLSQSEAEETLAAFGVAAAAQTAPGWSFQWNPAGEIGDSSKYASLQDVVAEGRRGVAFQGRGVLTASGTMNPNLPYVTTGGSALAARDESGQARYMIATFRMPKDSAGDVWLQHGNLQNRSFSKGTDLKIYRNGELVAEKEIHRDRSPALFQQPFGRLKAGDTITVAVGPGKNGAAGGGRLRFVLQDLPAGESPAPPLNVVWQPIDASFPQYEADATSTGYEAKHGAQNAAVLARKPELVFLGDSIIARWPQELLEQNFGEFRPVNLGIGGDWVQNVQWRIQHGVLGQAPIRTVVLLVGANNMSNDFTQDEIVVGVTKLVENLRATLPQAKILLLGVLPRRVPPTDPIRASISALNAKLQGLADEKSVFFLDVGPALVEPDGSVAPATMPDGLHVAEPGYLRWMEAMKPLLDRILAKS